jgi:4-hydroxy-2-oxoheptanedioate aldolase
VNPLLDRLRAGEPATGCLLAIGDGFSAETLAHCGFDWLCADLQHGMFGFDRCVGVLQALTGTGVTPLVRVPDLDAALIGKVLDAGAMGVVVPTVESADEARALVAATRYPPHGTRSVGPARARLYGGHEYSSAADEAIARIAMIETAAGVENVERIAAVERIDALFVGAVDLMRSLGASGRDDVAFGAALERVAAACRANGIAAGVFVESADQARDALAAGFTFLALGVDAHLLERAARALVGEIGAAGRSTR